MVLDDRLLVGRLLAGEEGAFEEFFEGFFPGLYRFAFARLGRDADVAEDVVQATLLAALGKLRTYRGEVALFTWLCTFCRHEISSFYRRAGRQVPSVTLTEDDPEVMAALESLWASSGQGAETSIGREEAARLVHVALDRLPRHYADALEWKYIEGISVEEIAGRLAVGPKAAESLLTRARAAFRDAFTTLTEAGIAWTRRPSGNA